METCGILFKSPKTGRYYVFKTNLKHEFINDLKSRGIDVFGLPARYIEGDFTVVLKDRDGRQYSYNCEGPAPAEEDGFELYATPIHSEPFRKDKEKNTDEHNGKN